jgi:hypothetical protein
MMPGNFCSCSVLSTGITGNPETSVGVWLRFVAGDRDNYSKARNGLRYYQPSAWVIVLVNNQQDIVSHPSFKISDKIRS